VGDQCRARLEVAVKEEQAIAGLTVRDYFAAQALKGMLSQPASAANVPAYDDVAVTAKWAYSFADAMLREREKQS
jgi:hypothetical protein